MSLAEQPTSRGATQRTGHTIESCSFSCFPNRLLDYATRPVHDLFFRNCASGNSAIMETKDAHFSSGTKRQSEVVRAELLGYPQLSSSRRSHFDAEAEIKEELV